MDDIMEIVTALYLHDNPIKRIAIKLHIISEQKVRKLLISAGQYRTKTIDEVARRAKGGESIEEISTAMNIGKKYVSASLPYSRGIYGLDTASKNALILRARKRKK